MDKIKDISPPTTYHCELPEVCIVGSVHTSLEFTSKAWFSKSSKKKKNLVSTKSRGILGSNR